MKLTRPQMLVLLGIVTTVVAIVTNVATNQIPERLKPYLWYSWPLLIILIIVLVVLIYKAEKEPEPPPPPELKLKPYYDALTKRYKTLDLDALTPPQKEEYLQLQLRSVFVEQSVRENPPPIELPKEILEKLQSEGELQDLPEGLSVEELRASGDRYYSAPSTPVLDVLRAPQNQQTIVLGDPGAGKSTLARYIMLSLIDADGDRRLRGAFPEYLPILIELRTFNALRDERKCDTFLQFLEYLGKTEGWNLTEAALDQKLKTAGTMVIFDGLDEVFDPEDREHISHSIVGFSHTYSKARIIVTSRIVGYQRRILTDAGFSHYTLQDLDRVQVESFIGRWYDLALSDRPDDAQRRKERILQSFDQSASVRQLAGNPMLLTIMAIIGKHQELPRERWKLYEHAVSVLIEHWEVKRHLEALNVDAPFMGEEDKKDLLRRLAHKMQAGRSGLKGNYIHRDELQAEFEDYLKTRFTLPPDRATTISRSMIDQFRQRNFILSLYGASVYGFVHRAFLEYFCATAFTYKFEKTQDITIQQLAVDVFETHWRDESWHEVLRLICGILAERRAGQLISHLFELSKSHGDSDSTLVNLELALRCLGEVRNLNLVVDATDLALKAIFAAFKQLMAETEYRPRGLDLLQNMLAAIHPIADNWPNRMLVATFLRSFRPKVNFWAYAAEFGEFVGIVGRGMDEVRDELIGYSNSGDDSLRWLWPEALAVGWIDDPLTIPLIKKQSLNDPSGIGRSSATGALRRHLVVTEENLSFMRERLQNDLDGRARYEALSYLSAARDNSSIPLFKEHLSHPDILVRYGAESALTPYLENEEVFATMLDKVPQESVFWLKNIFYADLVRARSDDPRVLDLLLRSAVNDENELTRSNTLRLLAEHFGTDARVRDLFRARAKDDPIEEVRGQANDLLAKLTDN